MAKTKYTDAALLVGSGSAGRKFCQIIFWFWALIGLFWCFPGVPGLPNMALASVSPATEVYWCGGLLVWGIGGLLERSYFDFKRPIEPTEPTP